MCISDWLRRTFSAFCQYLFAKIYILFIKIVTGSFLIPVTILLFLSLMALPLWGGLMLERLIITKFFKNRLVVPRQTNIHIVLNLFKLSVKYVII